MMRVTLLFVALLAGATATNNDQKAKMKSPIKQFCESTSAEKTKSIAVAKDEIEQLQATIAKAQADVTEITKYVAGLDSDMATWTDDLARTKAEREKAHALYLEAHKEY